ncbi:hypothetical protein BH09VER1_BH09VER1_35770 [soil metagenome]
MSAMELPPPTALDEKSIVTRERLRLLSLGYKISGVIGVVMVSFLLFHLVIFTTISFLPPTAFTPPAKSSSSQVESGSRVEPSSPRHDALFPFFIFRIVAGVIGLVILSGWILGALTFYAGHCLARRQHRTFIQVMAALNCLWIPYGTLLGVFTFIVLNTPEAEAEFPAMAPPPL